MSLSAIITSLLIGNNYGFILGHFYFGALGHYHFGGTENIDRKTRCVNDVDGGLKSGFSTAGPDPGKFNRAFNPYF